MTILRHCLIAAFISLVFCSSGLADDELSKPTMTDKLNGWWQQESSQSTTIKHTTDAGQHWLDVAPPILKSFVHNAKAEKDADVTLNVLDAQQAWVSIVPTTGRGILLEYTSDGGKHWLETPATIEVDATLISFLNSKTGFLLALGSPAAGSMMKHVYHTADGGLHWKELADPPSDGAYYPTGIVFSNSLDGWITATYHGAPDVPLYHSRDGGNTWQLQNLDVPDDYKGGYGNTYPPIFTGTDKKKGYLPVRLVRHDPKPGHTANVKYETEDGGRSWHLPAAGVQSTSDE